MYVCMYVCMYVFIFGLKVLIDIICMYTLCMYVDLVCVSFECLVLAKIGPMLPPSHDSPASGAPMYVCVFTWKCNHMA